MIGFLAALTIGAYNYLGYFDARAGNTYPVRIDSAIVNTQVGQHAAIWYGASIGQWPSRRSIQAGVMDLGGGPYAYIETRGTDVVFARKVEYGETVRVTLRCKTTTDVCTVSLLGHSASQYLPGRRRVYAGGESLFGASYRGFVGRTRIDD